MIEKLRKHRSTRIIAIGLSLAMLGQLGMPTTAWAISSGPMQAEFSSFTQASSSQLVNPVTGDFSYNIPLMSVEGYPLNLSYQAGIGMDQEASWVGLGWSLNPGVLNRTMRGLPDDFKGDEIKREFNLKRNTTVGMEAGIGMEIFGLGDQENIGFDANRGAGVQYNNYRGPAFHYGLDAGVTIGNLSVGLGVESHSQNGLSISPGVRATYPSGVNKAEGEKGVQANVGVGASYNSRTGLSALTIGGGVQYGTYRTASSGRPFNAPIVGTSFSSTVPIGSQTTIPSAKFPRHVAQGNYRYRTGAELDGFFITGYLEGTITEEYYQHKKLNTEGYGYLYAHKANGESAVMDFNREKESVLGNHLPNLPVSHQTYDLFSASGQGIGYSFRPHRNDFGSVKDGYIRETASSHSIGVEAGGGVYAKMGVNIAGSLTKTKYQGWDERMPPQYVDKNDPLVEDIIEYEPVYFKKGGDFSHVHPQFWEDIKGDEPVRMGIKKKSGQNTYQISGFLKDKNYGSVGQSPAAIDKLVRAYREKRSGNFQFLDAGLASGFALDKKVKDYSGATGYPYQLANSGHEIDRVQHASGKKHHISEVTVTTEAGSRYIYGVPVYSNSQSEISFNIAKKNGNDAVYHDQQAYREGLVNHTTDDASIENKNGESHYFEEKTLPKYATSFLLSAVVSSDYVDILGDGPSPDDLGTYTKFNYQKAHSDFLWKEPFNELTAAYNPGFRSDKRDDAASIMKGSKELWYLHSIETKNYVAEFILGNREDAKDTDGKSSRYLKRIDLFARKALLDNPSDATPLQSVHFVYDYTLCEGIPNNSNTPAIYDHSGAGTIDINEKKGKLTLKKLYYTFGQSKKGKLSPYSFYYGDKVTNVATVGNHATTDPLIWPTDPNDQPNNPGYATNSTDRWGVYKPQETSANSTKTSPLSNSEFPYTDQGAPIEAHQNAASWNLSTIKMPTGGLMKIDYQADDYGFVQDKRAMRMFKVTGMIEGNGNLNTGFLYGRSPGSWLDTEWDPYKKMRIELPTDEQISTNDYSYSGAKLEFIKRYMTGKDGRLNRLYFKFSVNTGIDEADEYDFVSGYLRPDYGLIDLVANGGNYTHVDIAFYPERAADKDRGDFVSPISKAGWQMIRSYLPKKAYRGSDFEGQNWNSRKAFFALTGIVRDAQEVIQGVNKVMRRRGYARQYVPSRSFVRLFEPDNTKVGGGHRVKRLVFSDSWKAMQTRGGVASNQQEETGTYGKEYRYVTENQKATSGVASYEPLVGGDENPWRSPIEYQLKRVLATNDYLYDEYPYGESLFPTGFVAYSRVEVRDYLVPEAVGNVSENGTGSTVLEFYTQKDFPYKISTTEKVNRGLDPDNFLGRIVGSLRFKTEHAYSQGFTLKMNDMHGKPKAVTVYAEGKSGQAYISKIEHLYQQDGNELDNEVSVFNHDGTVSTSLVRTDVDLTHDHKKVNIETRSTNVQLNTDVLGGSTAGFPVPIFVPIGFIWGQKNTSKATVLTKVIQQYGIPSKTIVHDQKARVETQALWYDVETGNPVLSQVTNQFDEDHPHVQFSIPAHLAYEGMGSAYRNLGLSFSESPIDIQEVEWNPATNQYHYVNSGAEIPSNAFLSDVNGTPVAPPTTPTHATVSGVSYFNPNGAIAWSLAQHLFPGDELAVMRLNSLGEFTGYEGRVWVLEDQNGTPGNLSVPTNAHPHIYLPDHNLSDTRFRTGASSNSMNPRLLVKRNGTQWQPVAGSLYAMKVIRSGRRNHLGVAVGGYSGKALSSSGNAIWTSPSTNLDVLSVSAGTFTQEGKLYKGVVSTSTTINPYVEGIRGNWRPDASYAYQADRSYASGTMKTDAYFEYQPFWIFGGSSWIQNPGISDDWLKTGQVTSYNPYGLSAESEDILGNRVAALPALFHSVQKAAANNAKLKEIAFESFEDMNMLITNTPSRFRTTNEHFGFYWEINDHPSLLKAGVAHTGNYSLKINPGGNLTMNKEAYTEDQTSTPDGVPFVLEGSDYMPHFGFDPVSTGKEFGFMVSYWRKLGDHPDGTGNYGPLSIDVNVESYNGSTWGSIPGIEQTIQTGNIIDGWQKVDVYTTFSGVAGSTGQRIVFDFINTSGTEIGYFDDFRVHPINSNMVAMVYDNMTNRLVAELDENNFATLYDFDESGAVVRVKRETHRGIVTLQETRHSTVKVQP